MIKDLPEGETQYDHFDELIAQLRVARDNFYRSKASARELRDAADWFEKNGWEGVQRELRRMADELEKK